jgi:hypothetical protein
LKFFKKLLPLLLIFSLNCTDGGGGPVSSGKNYVPTSVPELSIAESVGKQGLIHDINGKETILVIFPVVGVKLVNGKMRINQDVTVLSGLNTVDAKTNIYGPDGLTIDVLKIGGNPNLSFAGVELATEIVPPADLSGTILINIVVKDLNVPDSVVKLTRGFRTDRIFNPSAKPCVSESVAASASPGKTTPAEICDNEVIKTYPSGALPYLSGVEKATEQKAVDSFLIGKWQLTKPGFTWYSELKNSQNSNTDGSAAPPVPPGTLTINQNKQFIWEKADGVTEGTLEQVIPRSYADPKLTYWKVNSGKDNYYLYFKGTSIFLNDLDSHLYALIGRITS